MAIRFTNHHDGLHSRHEIPDLVRVCGMGVIRFTKWGKVRKSAAKCAKLRQTYLEWSRLLHNFCKVEP